MKSVGEYPLPEASVNSACSVGGYIVCLVGAAETAAPPERNLWASVKSVGEYPLPEDSVNSVNSVGKLMLVHECLVGAAGTAAPPGRLLQAFYLFY